MNTFQKVKSLIEAGHWVACKHKNGDYKVFTFVRRKTDGDVCLEGTAVRESIADCLSSGLIDASWNENEFNEYFTNKYEVVPRKPKVLTRETRVRILPIAKEIYFYGIWNEGLKNMVGNIYQIDDVVDCNAGISYLINGYMFPHYCVEEIFEDEPTEDEPTEEELDEMQMILEKAGRIISGKIVK